jgi:(2R)-3-sulfolactate dehydrogenase (NADP+)
VAHLSLQELHELAVKILVDSNTSSDVAEIVGGALTAAQADGQAGHGASRIPSYADQAKSGKVDGHAVPELTQTAQAAVRIDAKSGFAYPAITMGIDFGAELVEDTGVVALSVGHSHHSGAAGLHVERAARKGLIALSFGNTPAAIAPWGGNKALYGTNPIAFACPRENGNPLVVDLSMSKVARGKILVASQSGDPIPDDWAVDADGKATTDAKEALSGTMLPMGDAKGAALIMVVEILAATLTGSNYGFEASSFFDGEGSSPHVGQFFFLAKPGDLGGDAFADRLEVLLNAIKGQPGTRLPGDRRYDLRKKAEASGVDIPDKLHAELLARIG